MAQLDLLPEERLLRTAPARCYHPASLTSLGRAFLSYAEGTLYLTNLRLHWRRSRFNFPFQTLPTFDIWRRDVRGCFVRGSALVVDSNEGEYRFMLVKQRLWPPAFWYSKKTAEEWQAVFAPSGEVGAPGKETVQRLRAYDKTVFVAAAVFSTFTTLAASATIIITGLSFLFLVPLIFFNVAALAIVLYELWKLRKGEKELPP